MAKWFLDEPGSIAAAQLREEHLFRESVLVVPEFSIIETLNTIRYRGRDPLRALQHLLQAQLVLVPFSPELAALACDLALEYDLTIYDALYLALAKQHDCELITADTDFKDVPGARMLAEI